MNIRQIKEHVWVIDSERSDDIVLVRFPSEEITSVDLTEEIESSICNAYKEHLESMSEWSPHVLTVRDDIIERCLAGRLAFV